MASSDNMMTPDPREGTLPKWAQREITLLRMRLGEAREEVAGAYGDMPDAVAFTDPYSDTPRPVAKIRENVRFHFGDQDRIDCSVREDRNREVLRVYSERRIVLTVEAANVIVLRTEW